MENPHFIGREKEIALFRKSLEAILPENQGKPEYAHTPRILSFYGEKGVGKTELLNPFYDLVCEYGRFFYEEVNLLHQGFSKKGFFWNIKFKLFNGLIEQQLKKGEVLIKTMPFNQNEQLNIAKELLIEYSVRDIIELITKTKIPCIFVFDDYEKIYKTKNQWLTTFLKAIIRKKLPVLFVITSSVPLKWYFESIITNFYEQVLQPFTFEESKLFLNGFFSQFSDEYLRKIYDYTKGKPEQLQFLVDLIKTKQISAEAVLNELIRNEGKVISSFKELLSEKQGIEKSQKDVQMDVLAAMTHNLNHQFEYLQNDFATLKILIGKTARTEKESEKLDQILGRFQQNLSNAVNTFDNAHKVIVKEKIEPTKTLLLDFFQKEIQNFVEKPFQIEVLSKMPDLEAEIDQDVFKDLIKNLITNAEKHAFPKEIKNPKIIFEIAQTQEVNENAEIVPFVQIIYKDNGKGLPENFDFLAYKTLASKAGNSKGSGIGGYWINKIIALHHGKFRLKAPDQIFKLQFEILIPLYYITY